MSSKLTMSSMLYRIFEETRKWECNNFIPKAVPPVIRDRPICNHYVWSKCEVMPMKYDEFFFFVSTLLKITPQNRVIRERWNEMLRSGYLVENTDSGAYALQLNYIRPLFGEPNPGQEPERSMDVKTESPEEVST